MDYKKISRKQVISTKRRRTSQVGGEMKSHSFNSDMEVDNEEENPEAWEEMFDKDYSSFTFRDDWQWHINPEEWHLQEAIFRSLGLDSRITKIEEYDDHDASHKTLDVKQKGICTACQLKTHHDEFNIWGSTMEKGESSWSQCEICGDDKPTGAMEKGRRCGHFFCEDCIRVYLAETIQENIHKVKCPQKNCKTRLDIHQCRPFVPEVVYDRWIHARRESGAIANPTVRECPFIGCCAKFLDVKKNFKIKACPKCWRIFCLQCRDSYQLHMGKACDQFQSEVRDWAWDEAALQSYGPQHSQEFPLLDFFFM